MNITPKDRMLENIKTCLAQGEAVDLSDEEIERCMGNRCGVGPLTMYAKEFRNSGELLFSDIPHHGANQPRRE